MSESTDTLQVSREEVAAYTLVARRSLDQILAHAVADGEVESQPADASAMAATGAQFGIASAFVVTMVDNVSPLDVNGTKLRFRGRAFGVGLGGGTVWLYGAVEPASVLLGDVNFTLITNPLHTELLFWKSTTPVGGLIGGGLNVQVGVFHGEGKFTSW